MAAKSCRSLFVLFSLNGEIMEKVEPEPRTASVTAAELVYRMAEATTTVEIVNAVAKTADRADQRNVGWGEGIILPVKPDQRQFDLLVQSAQHLWPNKVLGLFQRRNVDRL